MPVDVSALALEPYVLQEDVDQSLSAETNTAMTSLGLYFWFCFLHSFVWIDLICCVLGREEQLDLVLSVLGRP